MMVLKPRMDSARRKRQPKSSGTGVSLLYGSESWGCGGPHGRDARATTRPPAAVPGGASRGASYFSGRLGLGVEVQQRPHQRWRRHNPGARRSSGFGGGRGSVGAAPGPASERQGAIRQGASSVFVLLSTEALVSEWQRCRGAVGALAICGRVRRPSALDRLPADVARH